MLHAFPKVEGWGWPPPAIAPDSRTAALCQGRTARLTSSSALRPQRAGAAVRGGRAPVGFTPDGCGLLTQGYRAVTTLWDVGTGKRLWSVALPDGLPHTVTASPDGKFLFTSFAYDDRKTGSRMQLRLRDASNGKLVRDLQRNPDK
jgi:hypothetical protein